MITRKSRIRQWDVLFLISYDPKDKERIIRHLLWAGAPNSIIERVSENIEADELNEGFTFSEPRERISIVGIGDASTGDEFLDSTIHEIFHVAQDIAIADGIPLDGEEIAYLGGGISHMISDIICELACPHCR